MDTPNGPGTGETPRALGCWVPPKEDKDPKRYAMRHFLGAAPEGVAVYHKPSPNLDQSSTSSCVGQTGRHWQLSEPNPYPSKQGEHESVQSLDTERWPAIDLYFDSQRHDWWEGGEYPGASPQYEGSSLSGLAKALQERGSITGAYAWAETPEDVTTWLRTVSGVMFASLWTRDMFKPDARGYVHPTGPIGGGHAYYIFGVNERGDWACLQSWRNWGLRNQTFKNRDSSSFTVADGVFWIAKEDQPALFGDRDAEGFAPVKAAITSPSTELEHMSRTKFNTIPSSALASRHIVLHRTHKEVEFGTFKGVDVP